MEDPQSPDYHLHIKAEPESLVGKTIVANGLKYTCYSPDWHRDVDGYHHSDIVAHNESEETLVLQRDKVVGTVTDYGIDGYTIEYENIETEEITERVVHDFLMVEMIRKDRWWVDE